MNIIKKAWVWLSRLPHSRGFGIQSPTDYRFVRYVINEHWPYYAYEQLDRNKGKLRRKLGKLYFRLANFLQPRQAIDRIGVSEYLKAGSHKTVIIDYKLPLDMVKLVLVPADTSLEELLNECGEQAVLVVECSGGNSSLTKTITQHPRTTVVFDLYYCFIVFFDSKRSKQYYTVNF